MINNKRRAVYIGMLVVFFTAIAVRIQAVNTYRAQPIVSYYEEWQKFGKPVEAHAVTAQDIPVFVRFTVTMLDSRTARGFVTGETKNALREGQFICDLGDTSTSCARIKSVATALDFDTGMFPVEVEFSEPRDPGSFLIISACSRTLKNVLAVPNESLDISEGEYFIWKNESGVARKRKVSLSSRNGYGAVIAEGLRSGDSVIFYGLSMLGDNDKLQVINDVGTDKKEVTQ